MEFADLSFCCCCPHLRQALHLAQPEEKGMTFKGCIGQPTVTLYSAAGIAWVDCAATGSLLGVAQRAGAEAAGAVSSRRR